MSQETLPEEDLIAFDRAFRFAIEAFDMLETGDPAGPALPAGAPDPAGQDERQRIDTEIQGYVTANREEVSALLAEPDGSKKLGSPHYLRLVDLGFKAIVARGKVTTEEIEADKKRMLDELESFKPAEGELNDEEMRDWMDVQKGLAMRFAGEIEPEEVAKEINQEYEAAVRLAPVVGRILSGLFRLEKKE